MDKGNYLSAILRSDKTVFSFKDIVLLWGESGGGAARVRVNYYVKSGDLYRIRKGFYAKDGNYDKIEFSTRIFTPAYASFETVLAQAGITFQYYSRIFAASYLTREIECDGQAYSFKKIKGAVLVNPSGMENKGNYFAASKERAFLDTLYINKDYHFDNLSPLDWNKVFEILPIYENKRMEKQIASLFKSFKSNSQ